MHAYDLYRWGNSEQFRPTTWMVAGDCFVSRNFESEQLTPGLAPTGSHKPLGSVMP